MVAGRLLVARRGIKQVTISRRAVHRDQLPTLGRLAESGTGLTVWCGDGTYEATAPEFRELLRDRRRAAIDFQRTFDGYSAHLHSEVQRGCAEATAQT